MNGKKDIDPKGMDLQERVIDINRVAKVVKGGRRFSFTALVAVGDEKSIVGVGYGKANEVPMAIQKGVDRAKTNLFRVPMHKSTITHEIVGRFGAGRVLLKPASPGTGVIAGGGVRAVLELAGLRDVLSKSLGTQNPINLVKATVNGLQSLSNPKEVARMRGKSIAEVLGIESADEGVDKEADSEKAEGPDGTEEKAIPGKETAAPVEEATPGKETPAPVKEETPGKETAAPVEEATPGKETATPAEKATPGTETAKPIDEVTPGKETTDPAEEATPGKETAA